MKKTLAISGASGFIGKELASYFKHFHIIKIARKSLQDPDKLSRIIEQSDILINLSGASILSRWSKKYKKTLHQSRIDTTKALVKALNKSSSKPELFVSTSAIGIYKNGTINDEENPHFGDDFLSKLCQEWEEEAFKAKGVRVCVFRFGVVLGHGGALKQMLTPFKLGLGGKISNGSQYFSYIHIKDLLRAYEFVMQDAKTQGVFNLVSPKPITNAIFTKALGKALKRPSFFRIPKFVLKLIFGEGAKILLEGQAVKPKRLLKAGFRYEFENIDKSLSDLLA